MSASRFHVGGVRKTIGRLSAPAQPSMTPRARPKANAATFASVGRAPTSSQKLRSRARARIPASNGALWRSCRSLPASTACRELRGDRRYRSAQRWRHARRDQIPGMAGAVTTWAPHRRAGHDAFRTMTHFLNEGNVRARSLYSMAKCVICDMCVMCLLSASSSIGLCYLGQNLRRSCRSWVDLLSQGRDRRPPLLAGEGWQHQHRCS
jgi:hypothetical protein